MNGFHFYPDESVYNLFHRFPDFVKTGAAVEISQKDDLLFYCYLMNLETVVCFPLLIFLAEWEDRTRVARRTASGVGFDIDQMCFCLVVGFLRGGKWYPRSMNLQLNFRSYNNCYLADLC